MPWGDTRQVRPPESKAYAVLNDNESPVSGAVIDALRNYQIQPVPWSQRVEVVTELAAGRNFSISARQAVSISPASRKTDRIKVLIELKSGVAQKSSCCR